MNIKELLEKLNVEELLQEGEKILKDLTKKPENSPLIDFLERIKTITAKDLAKNHSEDLLFRNTVEELGEYAAARTIEKGIKKKELKEDSLMEAIDLVICALSLYYLNGGKTEDLPTLGHKKLNKWENRVC